jgi:hypothetical protein
MSASGEMAAPAVSPVEFIKVPSGLEKVRLRGSRNCSVEVIGPAFLSPRHFLSFTRWLCVYVWSESRLTARPRGDAIRLDLGAVCADPAGFQPIRVGFGRN